MMARGASLTNGVYVNGDAPPPSTLAAQIVQNQSRYPAPQVNGNDPTFPELLHEILYNHAATPETDVNVNVQLISVVGAAGLAPLTESNPFAQWDALIAQATDSITVIQKTVVRQPEVLFTATSRDGPQLLLSLFARLAAICGRPKCEDIPVLDLLHSIVQVLWSNIDLWSYAQIVQHVIQDCVQGT